MSSTTDHRSITRRVVILVAVVPLAIAALGLTVLFLVCPETVVTGWGVNGEPRGTGDVWSLAITVLVLVPSFVAAMLAAALVSLRRTTSRLFLQSLIAISTWFSAMITGTALGLAVSQIGVDDVTSLPASSALVPLLVSSAPAAAMSLRPGELAYWSGRSVSSKGVIAIPVGVTLFILALFAVIGIPVWGSLLVLAVMISASTTLAWHVVVDRRGLRVTGLFGYPRFLFPIDSIVAAASIDLDPFTEFGGWGIRLGTRGRWGVVVRKGSAIEVERVDKAPFVVTVDDAEHGAALLTALAQR
jgi:hypothetical protein